VASLYLDLDFQSECFPVFWLLREGFSGGADASAEVGDEDGKENKDFDFPERLIGRVSLHRRSPLTTASSLIHTVTTSLEPRRFNATYLDSETLSPWIDFESTIPLLRLLRVAPARRSPMINIQGGGYDRKILLTK
jgi:hypothetical protein